MTFAARDILTPTHGTKVTSLGELVDGASYVVVSKGQFKPLGYATIRYCARFYFNVRSKADMSQLNLPHGTDN